MNILLNRTDALGDNILTMPLARFLWKAGARVYLLTSGRCFDLYLHNPWFSEIITFEKSWHQSQKKTVLDELFARVSFKDYLYVGGDQYPSFYAFKKGVIQRWGLRSRLLSLLALNKGVRQKRSEALWHESEYNLALMAPFLGTASLDRSGREGPEFFFAEGEREGHLKTFFSEFDIEAQEGYVIIHPGMTGHSLNLTPEQYFQIYQRLAPLFPAVKFIISFTPADEKFLIPFRLHGGQNLFFFNGMQKGIRHYLSALSAASLFIGGSTGTSHMANTLRVPMIAFYGPLKVQCQERWGPFYQYPHCRVFTPQVECPAVKTCLLDQCQHHECMAKLRMDDIIDVATKLLEGIT